MKLPPFESEFDASVLPQIAGAPLSHSTLDTAVGSMPLSRRVEGSQQTLVIDAVHSFYLAKGVGRVVASFTGYTNQVAPAALRRVADDLMRLAVIAVAAVNDAGQNSRTRSLPHTVDALTVALQGTTGTSVEQQGLANIKASVDHRTIPSLKYVHFVRNKWAGHASLDREFDKWADADTVLSIPLVEDALARLVNAHQALADLIDGSKSLKQLAKASHQPTGSAIPMSVAWNAVIPLAMVARESGQRQAQALLDQLQSPLGYGKPDDTDWRPGSEHHRRRQIIDRAVALMAESED
ncbi:hypothetical protein [Ornithinicoccus halotolerans]|uniref:hypothetical protein n=1 Tax=Ornithinicoccus halotolerans TaxID=1748220 RepID=UPI0012968140|nr:hypothetical protein [Ornithinicoccus halotolerans]